MKNPAHSMGYELVLLIIYSKHKTLTSEHKIHSCEIMHKMPHPRATTGPWGWLGATLHRWGDLFSFIFFFYFSFFKKIMYSLQLPINRDDLMGFDFFINCNQIKSDWNTLNSDLISHNILYSLHFPINRDFLYYKLSIE